MINGLQVAAGLLLLSVSAATSLAEERQRGSLDVLLATPLPTRSIVWGKWWGAFRGVPPLPVLPVLIAAALATHTGFALGPVLIGGLILAYGAAITSLGLALATWMPRMGRAIGLTAGLYVVVLIAAVPVGMILFGDGPKGPAPASPRPARSGASASPAPCSAAMPGRATRSGARPPGSSSGSSPTAWSRSPCCWRRWGRSTAASAGSTTRRPTRNPSLAPPASPRPRSPTQSRRSTSTSDPARPRRWPTRRRHAAERAPRHGVIWRKLSLGTAGVMGSRFVERMLSVAETCRRRGRDVLAYRTGCVRSALEGTPSPSPLA